MATYKQLVSPNTNVTDGIGWCLRYARNMFGAPTGAATAWKAWERAQFKHANRDIPANVSVLLFFSYFEKGVNYGHVVVSVPGKGLYSSPYKSGTGSAVLKSIEEVERLYHCKFVGWTEDVNGKRVVEAITEPVPPPVQGHPLAQYVGRTVRLAPEAGTWRVYPVGSTAPRTAVATLKVAKFGGLEYRIEQADTSLNSVVISTRDFGKVSLPIAQDNRGTLYPTATIK